MKYKRFDLDRIIELLFIEDVKILQKYGLNEYYDKANRGLFEFLNPELSYPYSEENMGGGQKMWKVEKQKNDPQFLVTLKEGAGEYWVLDFYFFETGFKKQEGLTGKYYIDTLSKIIRDNIIPYFSKSKMNELYFNSYSGDGGGLMRKKVFSKLIDKFVDKDKFNIEIDGMDFIITKK
jgi:hypothetical protein